MRMINDLPITVPGVIRVVAFGSVRIGQLFMSPTGCQCLYKKTGNSKEHENVDKIRKCKNHTYTTKVGGKIFVSPNERVHV